MLAVPDSSPPSQGGDSPVFVQKTGQGWFRGNSALRRLLDILLIGLLLALIGYSAQAAFAAQRAEQAIAKMLDVESTPGNVVDKAVYSGTFGLIGKAHLKRIDQLETLHARAAQAKGRAGTFGLGALAAGLLFLLMPVRPTDRPGLRRRLRVRRIIPVALIALAAGISLPMLSAVTAFGLPVAGEVVVAAQSKSILGTIRDLFNSDPLLAVLIALFSIATPFAKLGLLALLARREDAPRLHRWVERIGRWSMTDVFVVALLLTFLALGTREQNAAHIEIGLYYFLAAALLPILAMEILPAARGEAAGMLGKNQRES